MATQALYLKYRPLTFDQVVGQEPITKTLRNALRQGTVRHAYLFTGPRGTGKTTTARLLAKAVNCKASPGERPCNTCASCIAINEGRLLDLIEVDAASNRGIDEVRDIREKARFRPNQVEYKVYVLDEAHMLTQEAFNALLKTLEEPPPHVIFVLVTTEPHKILPTIASRCQRFDFKRVRLQSLVDRLASIAEQEGVRVEPAGLELIARHSTGGMRDAISLLDQMTSYGDEISLKQVQIVLGTVTSDVAARVVSALAEENSAAGLEHINAAVGDGADPRQVGREIVELLRGVLLVQQGAGLRLLSTTAEQAAEVEQLAKRLPEARVVQAIRLFNDATTDIKRGGLDSIPQLPLEMALVQSFLEGGAGVLFSTSGPAASAAVPHPAVREAPAPALRPRSTEPQPHPQYASPDRARSQPAQEAEGPQAASPVVPESTEQSPAQATSSFELDEVQSKWKQIVRAMRQHNYATQAVLASGCKPVAVMGDQVTITVPSRILAEKLRDAARHTEIENVMARELGTHCRVKLVVEADYAPADLAVPGRVQAAGQTPTQGAEPAAPDTQADAQDSVPDPLIEWAQQRGGTARLVDP
ncbi:MAG TPA: DNA polymerase III subunit gamma/tau [Anaerolineae bacterium]|nr:DNA polymerase III subunit gamma/tau [Anaerolineae bacterium]